MPTTRKRHTITETDEVERALRPLRARGMRISFPDLVIMGAERALERDKSEIGESEKRLELRRRFLDRLESGKGIDLGAALEARDRSWHHDSPLDP